MGTGAVTVCIIKAVCVLEDYCIQLITLALRPGWLTSGVTWIVEQ